MAECPQRNNCTACQNCDSYQQALKIFRLVAAEFAGIPDEDQTDDGGNVVRYGLHTYFLLFADEISCRRFGKTYPKALAYLTAHKLKMLNVDGSEDGKSTDFSSDALNNMQMAYRLASVSEGESSISFRDPMSSSGSTSDVDADYKLTQYGIEYLKLRRNCIVPIISSGEPVRIPPMNYGHNQNCLNYGGEANGILYRW